MTVFTDVRNPVALQDGRINCEILHVDYGWIPFTASPDDDVQYGRDLHAALLAGDHGTVGAYVPPDAAVVLAAERAGMVLTRTQFARQARIAGKMTAAEALNWGASGAPTALVTAALALVPAGDARDDAAIVFATAQSIDRTNQLMTVVTAAAEWTDAQMDDFFRAGMLL